VSFSFVVSVPQEISHQDRLGTKIANSMDLRACPLLSLSREHTAFFQKFLSCHPEPSRKGVRSFDHAAHGLEIEVAGEDDVQPYWLLSLIFCAENLVAYFTCILAGSWARVTGVFSG
jgi:hypothetical protein